MQEEIENRTVNLAITTTKLTWRVLLKALTALHAHFKTNASRGKQSIKKLVGQNRGVNSVPIEKTDLKGFEKSAKKYGIDFSIVKDKTTTPPRYTVFFKAQDADALTSAFEEFTNQKLKGKTKPSILKQLDKLKQLIPGLEPTRKRRRLEIDER